MPWTNGKPKKSKVLYQLASGNFCIDSKIFIRNSVLETTSATHNSVQCLTKNSERILMFTLPGPVLSILSCLIFPTRLCSLDSLYPQGPEMLNNLPKVMLIMELLGFSAKESDPRAHTVPIKFCCFLNQARKNSP